MRCHDHRVEGPPTGGPPLTCLIPVADTIPEDFQEFQTQSFDRLDN